MIVDEFITVTVIVEGSIVLLIAPVMNITITAALTDNLVGAIGSFDSIDLESNAAARVE